MKTVKNGGAKYGTRILEDVEVITYDDKRS